MAGDEAQVDGAFGDRLRSAFDELIDIAPANRRAFVQERFAGEAKLRGELLGMLEHLEVDTTFIEPPDPEEVKDALDWTTTDPASSGPALEHLAGTTVAGRYRLDRRLGRGGSGVVYEAEDALGGARVAVKLLRGDPAEGRHEQRWEATALRLLRLPGVVQLLDEGTSEGIAYLVTELVDGAPFPGRPASRAWQDVRDTALALLETLERVHWAGIVHRDLKPANVLVDARGRPHVLDLGIAEDPTRTTTHASRSARRGTLGYMAPEQLRGETATPRSDLYSVGVMLHEALSGQRYRTDASVRLARFGLVSERSKPLGRIQGDLPDAVRQTIARMLEVDPAERPGSAREVLDALLGPTDAPSGRTAFPLPIGDAAAGRDEPLQEADLCRILAGPDRLLHLRKDGARELAARTGGAPRAVLRELDAWGRAGLGWWDGPRYRLRRRDLDVLQRGLRVSPRARSARAEALTLGEADLQLAHLIDLAGVRATVPLAAQVLDRSPTAIRRAVERLEAAGLVRRAADDRLELIAAPPEPTESGTAWRPDLHRRLALALEPGDEQRLYHWVAAGSMDPVPAESIAVATMHLEAGRVDAARAIVREGLRALTHRPDTAWQIQLLELDLLAAIESGTTAALDHALLDLGRAPTSPRVERLEAIARGALHALGGEPQRALEEVPVPDEAASEVEQRAAWSVRTFAGRALGSDALRRVLEEAEAQTAPHAARVRSQVAVERAWLAYREGRFEQAAEGHLGSAAHAPHAIGLNRSLLNAASAFLEAGLHDRAYDLGTEAAHFARQRRLVPQETRAEWIRRAAAYRRGDPLTVDVELALASTQVGSPHYAGLICLTEAAIAWRTDRHRTAARLAATSAQALQGPTRRWPRFLATTLGLVCTPRPDPSAAEAALEEAKACPSARVVVQAAGLLARAATPVRQAALDLARARNREIPASERDLRREILSAAEAVKSPPANA